MRSVYLPNVFGSIPYTVTPSSPDTDVSTAQTVGIMNSCIQAAHDQPAVVTATRQALRSVAMSAPAWRKAQAIWEWVHRNIRFKPDEEILAQYFGLPADMELLQRPELLLATRRGDCDCFTMLACAMLLCAGVPYRIVTIAADRDQPSRFSHVYAAAILENGDEVPMDTSHGRFFGWQAPRRYRTVEWAA